MHDRGSITDAQLWAARRFAIGYRHLTSEVAVHGFRWEKLHPDHVSGWENVAAATENERLSRISEVDDYLEAAAAMDDSDANAHRLALVRRVRLKRAGIRMLDKARVAALLEIAREDVELALWPRPFGITRKLTLRVVNDDTAVEQAALELHIRRQRAEWCLEHGLDIYNHFGGR